MSTTSGTTAPPSAAAPVPRHARVLRLLDSLGISRAHFAGRHPVGGLQDVLSAQPELVASVTLITPDPVDARPFTCLEDRVLVIHGDGSPSAAVRRVLAALPEAAALELRGHESFFWLDTVAERTDQVAAAMEGLRDGCADVVSCAPATERAWE